MKPCCRSKYGTGETSHISWLAGLRSLIESFNGRLRDELLNETLFSTLSQARIALAAWRADYNGSRPHSKLSWLTPSAFASTFDPRRELAPSYANGSPPAPVARSAQQTNHNPQ